MPAASSSARKLRLFISYSRKDDTFVDRLGAALKDRGFEPTIDRSDIAALEEWWARIRKLIEGADTIVYVVSPDSVTSEVALREIAYADSLSKRFAPIVCRRIDPRTVPNALSKLNFIFFDDPSQFEARADDLAEALVTDLAWIRRHTELGEAALQWSRRNRANGLLLRSPALEEAERWIAARPEDAPAPTADTQDFIRLSRQAATRRRNTLTASLAAGMLLALGLAGLAYWQRTIAVEQRDATLVNRSLLLADAAYRAISDGDAATGILLALEGLPDGQEGSGRPHVRETDNMLLSGLLNLRERAVFDIWSLAAVSPGGTRVGYATLDDTVEVIDVATKEKVATLRHKDPRSSVLTQIRSIAFSSDDARLVTLANDPSAPDGLIRIWDLAASRELLRLKSYAGFNDVSLSPDGRKLLLVNGTKSDGANHGALVWDTVTLARLLLLPHPASVVKAAYSRDGRLLATAASDNVVRVFDAATGAQRNVLRDAGGQIFAIAFSRDNSLLLAASSDGIGYVWRLSDGSVKHRLAGHGNAPWGAGFLGDGGSILTTTGEAILVWDANTGERLETHKAYIKPLIKGATETENNLAFGIKRDALVTTHSDNSARLWELGPRADAVLGPRCPPQSMLHRVLRDGSRIVVYCSDRQTIQIWDAFKEHKVLELAAGGGGGQDKLLLSPDEKVIALAGGVGPIRLWSAADGRALASFPNSTEVRIAAFDPQSRRFAVGGEDGKVRLWDLSRPPSEWTAQDPILLAASKAGVDTLAFSPAGDRLLTLSADRTPRIWDAASGKLLLTLSDPKRSTKKKSSLRAAFSPDGRLAATDSHGNLEIWDAASGKRLKSIRTATMDSAQLEFSADGRRLITSPGYWYLLSVEVPSGRPLRPADEASVGGFSYDRDAEIIALAETDPGISKPDGLRLFDAKTFRTIKRFNGPFEEAEISFGGQRLTARTSDGRLHTWTLPPRGAERVSMARRLVPRCLETLQREEAGLDPVPPRWCITGPDHVAEKDPSRWQGKWPYNRKEWHDWLLARDKGESPPWPNLHELFYDPDDEAEAAGAPPPPK
jgi:WD40 repeat protein